jgi:hypothetical protein
VKKSAAVAPNHALWTLHRPAFATLRRASREGRSPNFLPTFSVFCAFLRGAACLILLVACRAWSTNCQASVNGATAARPSAQTGAPDSCMRFQTAPRPHDLLPNLKIFFKIGLDEQFEILKIYKIRFTCFTVGALNLACKYFIGGLYEPFNAIENCVGRRMCPTKIADGT